MSVGGSAWDNGRLPEGWRWAKLGEFLRHDKEFFTIDDSEEYQLVTVRLHGKGIEARERLEGSKIRMKRQQRIEKGQLLVAEIDAKMGAFGLVPPELDGAIVSSHYFLFDFIDDGMLPAFFECFIVTDWLRGQIQRFVQGALNYAAIRPYHVLEAQIVVPPRNFQARFARQFVLLRQ